jgi:CubicO group peptidase (beta-lactamase class C family)
MDSFAAAAIVRRAVACLILAAACGTPRPPIAAPPPPDGRWTVLDHDMPGLLAEYRIPSVSLARIEHGEIVWTAAYGTQRPGVPATPATLYNVASLTKPISSETVLRLAAIGRLSLDEPMSAYWIDPDIANDERHKRLTLRLALSHRTGFANWRRQTGGVLAFQNDPGDTFGYSGEGFEYVARFVAHKIGTGFEALAQQQVLDPIGMTNTAYTKRPWFEGRVAVPTDEAGTPLTPHFAKEPLASDLLYSTPRDYARFLLAVVRHDGLTPALAAERDRVQTDVKAMACTGAAAAVCPDEIGIGLAWMILRFGDQTLLMHTGSDDGVYTFAYVNLATGSGTVIFTNSANGKKIVAPIVERLGADRPFLAFLQNTR